MNKWFNKFRSLGIFIVIAAAAFSAVTMLLWNALMPELFGLPVLNYWQAVGILLLARILFGGAGGKRFMPGRMDHAGRGCHHGNPLREKWMNMTEEERKAFIEKEKAFHHFFHDRFSSHSHGFYTGNGEPKENKKEGGKD
jgi:hypothetical protein